MATTGSYEFKLSEKAKDGAVEDSAHLARGEWAWTDRKTVDGNRWLMLHACCPDCGMAVGLWRKYGDGKPVGHDIDAQGNVHPSVLHSYHVDGKETCGFHTMPTKLLGFVDLR